MRKAAYITSLIVGIILILGGIATWIVVSNTLAAQNITVSDDADCLAGDDVDGPLSAFCQARVIDKHTLEITEGKTYAELDREDPTRATVMNASFLRASLFTSVLAFGVAFMAGALGVLNVLLGISMMKLANLRT